MNNLRAYLIRFFLSHFTWLQNGLESVIKIITDGGSTLFPTRLKINRIAILIHREVRPWIFHVVIVCNFAAATMKVCINLAAKHFTPELSARKIQHAFAKIISASFTASKDKRKKYACVSNPSTSAAELTSGNRWLTAGCNMGTTHVVSGNWNF